MTLAYKRGFVAVTAGMLLNFLGDWITGINIETFKGISTFTFSWMLDVFLVPFITGFIVAKIYRDRGGKYLACLPPLFVRCITYFYMYMYVYNDGKDFNYHLNLYYWGPCVILAVEASNFGAIIGEVLAGAYRTRQIRTLENAINKRYPADA